jgi:hypothetical protein
MTMSAAGRTFFFDIGNFPAGGNLPVAADDAAAAESGETEKSNETHRVLHSRAQQYTCRIAWRTALRHRAPAPHSSTHSGTHSDTHFGTGATADFLNQTSEVWSQLRAASSARAWVIPLRAAAEAGSIVSASAKYFAAACGFADCK